MVRKAWCVARASIYYDSIVFTTRPPPRAPPPPRRPGRHRPSSPAPLPSPRRHCLRRAQSPTSPSERNGWGGLRHGTSGDERRPRWRGLCVSDTPRLADILPSRRRMIGVERKPATRTMSSQPACKYSTTSTARGTVQCHGEACRKQHNTPRHGTSSTARHGTVSTLG